MGLLYFRVSGTVWKKSLKHDDPLPPPPGTTASTVAANTNCNTNIYKVHSRVESEAPAVVL